MIPFEKFLCFSDFVAIVILATKMQKHEITQSNHYK